MRCFLHLKISQVTLCTYSLTRRHTHTHIGRYTAKLGSRMHLFVQSHSLAVCPALCPQSNSRIASLARSLSRSSSLVLFPSLMRLTQQRQRTHLPKARKVACSKIRTHTHACHCRWRCRCVCVCVTLCASTTIYAAYSLSLAQLPHAPGLSLVLNLFWRSLCARRIVSRLVSFR